MKIDTGTMIPWKSTNPNENLLVDFLFQACCWKGAHTFGDKETFFIAFAKFCIERGTTSEPRGITETRLARLGHEVNSTSIRGVFVRTGDEVPAPESGYTPAQKLAGGSAAVSFPPPDLNDSPISESEDELRERIYHERTIRR